MIARWWVCAWLLARQETIYQFNPVFQERMAAVLGRWYELVTNLIRYDRRDVYLDEGFRNFDEWEFRAYRTNIFERWKHMVIQYQSSVHDVLMLFCYIVTGRCRHLGSLPAWPGFTSFAYGRVSMMTTLRVRTKTYWGLVAIGLLRRDRLAACRIASEIGLQRVRDRFVCPSSLREVDHTVNSPTK